MEKYLQEYSKYVCEHKAYVRKAFSLLLPFVKANLNLSEEDMIKLVDNIDNHDKSKFEVDEFVPYAEHFYGGGEKDTGKFRAAVKLHEMRNPHHAEFWKGENIPTIYLIEMVCDWWSFSLRSEKPKEVLDWYSSHKEKLGLNASNTQAVESLLNEIKTLDYETDK